MNKFMKEKDQFRDELKILKDAKEKVEKQKEQQGNMSKETINKLTE